MLISVAWLLLKGGPNFSAPIPRAESIPPIRPYGAEDIRLVKKVGLFPDHFTAEFVIALAEDRTFGRLARTSQARIRIPAARIAPE